MELEWDQEKRRTNLRKHGLDFADAVHVLEGITIVIEDTREDYGEDRFIAIGTLKGRVVVVVYTGPGEATRIISMRKATKYEESSYYEQVGD